MKRRNSKLKLLKLQRTLANLNFGTPGTATAPKSPIHLLLPDFKPDSAQFFMGTKPMIGQEGFLELELPEALSIPGQVVMIVRVGSEANLVTKVEYRYRVSFKFDLKDEETKKKIESFLEKIRPKPNEPAAAA